MAELSTRQIPGAVDTNVRIPRQARAQGKAVDDFYEAQKAANDAQNDPKTLENDPKTAQNQGDLGQNTGESNPDLTVNQELSDDGQGGYKHKFESLQGRFSILQRQNQDLMSSTASMRHQLNEQAQQIARLSANPPTSTQKVQHLTPEERASYGDEFVDVAARAAREQIDPVIAQQQRDIEELKAEKEQRKQETAQQTRQRFFGEMDAALPDWKTINRSQKFVDWLALQDPYSGDTRFDLLNKAYQQSNSPRCLQFFKGFLAEEAATAPPAQTQPPVKDGQISLEDLAAPGRSKTVAATSPTEKPSFTRAQIAQFYRDKAQGKYSEEDGNRLERQISEAANEGRVS